ncbi:hypothetical protein MJO29_013716 [Puccinia striiformis f. sp. tritici]|nr:hypothetical protein MJO29_013716 [Puccinia striiformis f. sp. tritici]
MLSNFVLSFSILVVLFASLTLVESGTYGGTQVTLPIREKKLPPIVTTDTTGTTNATGTTGTNSTTSALALTNTSKICDVESPTPEVWKARNISGFLSSYPNGNNLTLAVTRFFQTSVPDPKNFTDLIDLLLDLGFPA